MGFMLLGLMVGSRAGTMTGAQILPAVLFYLAVGVVFIVFGIGTILVKRWARKLMLIFAWVWLVSGVLGSISMLFMMPVMEKAMNAGGKLPPGTFIVVAIIMAVVFLLIFLLLPGIFILFYGSKKAKAAVEAWDTKESWTDKCPAPVLAVSLLSGLGVVFMVLFMPFYHFVLPFFGTFLYGWPGALLWPIARGDSTG
jgi:hypothetical protein